MGGGSPIDAAKAIRAVAKETLHIDTDRWECFAVPTTSGTGSEVSRFAVITDREKGVKYPLVEDSLLPDIAILDAELTTSVPPTVTADTGIDVFTHAVEAFVSTEATDFSDAAAEKAIKLVKRHLLPAYQNPEDRKARQGMHNASCLAGIAFNAAGLGICHSLAHALGGRFHLPHGRLNALILPHVIHFNAADGTAAEKYGRLARLCGLAANPRSLAAGLNRLRAQLKLPERLSACGVEGKELTAALDGLAEAAQADLCAPSNPRPAAAEDLKSLLRELA